MYGVCWSGDLGCHNSNRVLFIEKPRYQKKIKVYVYIYPINIKILVSTNYTPPGQGVYITSDSVCTGIIAKLLFFNVS